jgi:hypothetical protein
MAFVALPTLPRLAKITPKLVRFGGDLTSITGGPTQRVSRLGTRFSIQVDLPTMDAACAATWIAAQLQAEAEGKTLRLALPQFGISAAAPTVGAGAGAALSVSSAAGIAVGMWFSFVASSHAYLHAVTAISGTDLSVAPQLRVDPAGLGLNFAAPVVEGFDDGAAWSMEMLRFVGQSFMLSENR